MDLQSFKVKNDYAKGIGSGIFEYQNLSDLEKVLFLEHNVTELIALLKRKNNAIKEMDEQMTRIIEDKEESKVVKALKAEITNNQRSIKQYKDLITRMTGTNK